MISFILEGLELNMVILHIMLYFWIVLIRTISQGYAMYCLVLFYFILKSLPKHSNGYRLFISMRPIPKFLCIKGIVFFTYWQSVLIAILVYTHIIQQTNWFWTAQNIGTALQNFVFVLKCCFFPLVIGMHSKLTILDQFKMKNQFLLLGKLF